MDAGFAFIEKPTASAPTGADNGVLVANENSDQGDATFAFSLDGAVAALETQASRALQTHGSAPSESGLTANTNQERASAHADSQQQPLSVTEEPLTPSRSSQANSSGPVGANAPTENSEPVLRAQPVPQTPIAQNLAVPSGPAISAPISQAVATQSGLAPAASNTARTARPLAQAAQDAPATRQAPTQRFATLLSQQLQNGKTNFEIRLDPPSLGRVDASYTPGDEPSLTLRFEHESSLDLFRKDAENLRALLSDAGVDTDKPLTLNFETLAQHDASHKDASTDQSARNEIPIFLNAETAPSVTGRAPVPLGSANYIDVTL